MTEREMIAFTRDARERGWYRTKAGRRAINRALCGAPDTVTFRFDTMTVIGGRVCYTVCPATARKLRYAFRYAGVWYVPERAVRLTGPDAAGSTLCVSAADDYWYRH